MNTYILLLSASMNSTIQLPPQVDMTLCHGQAVNRGACNMDEKRNIILILLCLHETVHIY